jgi:hypothetical protein
MNAGRFLCSLPIGVPPGQKHRAGQQHAYGSLQGDYYSCMAHLHHVIENCALVPAGGACRSPQTARRARQA